MRKSLSGADLKKILETTNERDLFIVGHMYIENTIDRILEKKFNIPIEALDDPMIMWTQKYLILEKSGLLKGNVKKNVRLINSIRNRYAHRLKPDEKAIGNNIRELEYLGVSHTNPTTKFEKYRICVISTFTVLEKML